MAEECLVEDDADLGEEAADETQQSSQQRVHSGHLHHDALVHGHVQQLQPSHVLGDVAFALHLLAELVQHLDGDVDVHEVQKVQLDHGAHVDELTLHRDDLGGAVLAFALVGLGGHHCGQQQHEKESGLRHGSHCLSPAVSKESESEEWSERTRRRC